MDFLSYSQRIKAQILEHIQEQCLDIEYPEIPYSSEIAEKIYEYTSRGKLLRGVFTCLSAESFGHELDKEIFQAAASLEIAQSALLMHDDVMDQDDFRRNKASVHKQFRDEGFSDHGSNSLAMCLGDVALFHVFRYLNKDLCRLFSIELTKTAIGQTYDVMKANKDEELTEEEIRLIIQNKTANYTFALPFKTGVFLANGYTEKNQKLIDELSLVLGLIFQIKDDELNYLEEGIGKSTGGDIRENKKTLCRLFLIEEYPHTKTLYGTNDGIEEIRRLYEHSKAKQKIAGLIEHYTAIAKEIINDLPIKKSFYTHWESLLDYLQQRKF